MGCLWRDPSASESEPNTLSCQGHASCQGHTSWPQSTTVTGSSGSSVPAPGGRANALMRSVTSRPDTCRHRGADEGSEEGLLQRRLTFHIFMFRLSNDSTNVGNHMNLT